VVCGRELELYHVADVCFDVAGRVGLGAVHAADFDDVDGCAIGCWRDVSCVRVIKSRIGNVPKAPATLMADRRSVVNCILKYF
jgi:hypothetical protein